jgi:hypothetical protein
VDGRSGRGLRCGFNAGCLCAWHSAAGLLHLRERDGGRSTSEGTGATNLRTTVPLGIDMVEEFDSGRHPSIWLPDHMVSNLPIVNIQRVHWLAAVERKQ